MWHLTACKISVSLLFLNWTKNEMIFYHISKLIFFLFGLTDNFPSWKIGRGIIVEIISLSLSMKIIWLSWDLNLGTQDLQSELLLTMLGSLVKDTDV